MTKRVTNTTYHIQDDKDPTTSQTVHRNQLVEYYPKKETLIPMIEEYVPMDRHHDDFYERFMEQEFQKLNNSEQPIVEDSLPFPFEPLRTAPVAHPQKRVSKTSSDSGVNTLHALSPVMPTTPDNSQPYLIPSTLRMNAPCGPLTPIQQFIHKNKEPMYNRTNFNSQLLTKVYWSYATHIVRVCVSSKSPINPNLHINKKSNNQVHFGSRAMASLYELQCHQFLTSSDPLLDELLCYLPTRFLSHVFDHIAYESSDNE